MHKRFRGSPLPQHGKREAGWTRLACENVPDYRRKNCRRCGGHESKVGSISWMGNCDRCARLRFEQNLDDLQGRTAGPFALYWRRRCLAAFGVGLDDPPMRP